MEFLFGRTVACIRQKKKHSIEPHFYVPAIYIFLLFATFLGPFIFPIFIMHCLPRFSISEISNFPQFTPLQRSQKEQF
jgi:hypothetical protein